MPGAGGVNLWEMVAKIEADFSQSDRAIDQNERKVDKLIITYRNLEKETSKASASHGKFSSVLGGLERTTSSLGGPLGGMLGKVQSLTGAFGEGAAAAGPWGVAIGAVAALTVGAAAGIVSLTVAVSEQTGKFIDLSQATGFQVETLSALSNALETSGGDIETATQSLFIFETKMGEAKEKGSELSKVFKVLGIDTHDNEKALRQALDALQHMTDAETKATLGKKLFGKSAKELLAALAEAGSFQEFYNKQLADGTLITTKEAKAGDDLSDSIVIVKREMLAAGRAVATEFGPMVTDALKDFSHWLKDNQGEIRSTAKEVKDLVIEIKSLADFIYSISPLRLIVEVLRVFKSDDDSNIDPYRRAPENYGGDSYFTQFKNWMLGDTPKHNDAMVAVTPTPGAATPEQMAAYKKSLDDKAKADAAAAAAAKKKQDEINKLLSAPKGGGHKGGGGEDPAKIAEQVAKLKLDATVAGLKAEQDANRRSLELRREDFNTYATQYMVIENRRHDAVIAGLNKEEEAAKKLKKGKEVALQQISNRRAAEETEHEQNRNAVLDQRGKILDQIDKFLLDQDRSIDKLTHTTSQWDEAYQQLVDTLKEEGVTLEDNTRKRIESNVARLKELELMKQERSRYASQVVKKDLGGGSFILTDEVRDSTGRPRVATTDEIIKREQLEIFRDRMRTIAADLTFTIDNAMRDGFEHGIKHGIITFGLGILEMARSAALKELEKAIAKALIGGDGGEKNASGTGGILSKVISFGISALGALFGGGLFGGSQGGAGSAAAGAIGAHAGGGYMKPFEWSWVGESGRELVRAGYHGATVISNGDSEAMGGGNTYNISMPIHVPNMAAAGTRETQHQVRRALAQTLKEVSLKG